MVSAQRFAELALALPGTSQKPHFDRLAFKAKRNFATLAADGSSANVKLTNDQQAMKCAAAPEVFSEIDNAWGRQGWTRISLLSIDEAELVQVLKWAHAMG